MRHRIAAAGTIAALTVTGLVAAEPAHATPTLVCWDTTANTGSLIANGTASWTLIRYGFADGGHLDVRTSDPVTPNQVLAAKLATSTQVCSLTVTPLR